MKTKNRISGNPHGRNFKEERLTEIKFVGIEFDEKKIPRQELELNKYLQSNYQILERVQTATGLVFLLGKFQYTSPLLEEENNEYCFPRLDRDQAEIKRGAEVA